MPLLLLMLLLIFLPLALIARFYTGVSAAADVGCFCL
jgi:hypothetical protein